MPPSMDDWADLNPIGGPIWATTLGEASLRGQPDIADNRFGFARPGTPLKVLGASGDWTYVFNPHTQGTAYVSSSLLAPGGAPSRFVSMPAPPLIDQIQDTVVIPQDSILATYPSPVDEALFTPLKASTVETINGTVRGADGAIWYQTRDFYYIPSNAVFLSSASESYTGRWLDAKLLPTTRVVAYDGQVPVRTMFALRGIHGQTLLVYPALRLVLVHTAVRVKPNNDPATVQPNAHAAMPGAAAAARKGSPSRAIGHPRARSAMDQFLVLSTSWSFLSHGIMARNRAPTSSIGCCSPRLSKALYWGRLAWHSSIHSLANRPLWISSRMRFISCLVSSVMMRGPRVTSPYLAVVLIE